ncbi:MAG: TonB-dependent receptor [Kiritimatiellae bacterium]|nr:TonB-dependent receptor [Kiritimatiellia bacterium]
MKQLLIQLTAYIVCALSITTPFNASAAETPIQSEVTLARTNMPPVIVEASRTFKTKEEIASHVTIITAEDINKKGRKDIVDVLRKDAGIFIRSLNSNPAQSQISMRGFGANSHGRVLVMVDGERLNNPDMSAPNLLRVPLSTISRIEVLHGSQTVLFGDYAEAGVINIVTLTPGEERTTLSASGGSDETFSAGIQHAGAFEDGVSYSAGLDWNKSDGYRQNGDYESWNAKGSITKQWSEKHQVTLSTFYNNSEFGWPGSLTYNQFQENPKASTTPDDESKQKRWGTRLYVKTDLGDEGILDATLTAGRRESETDWASLKGRTEYDTDDYAFSPKYSTPWDIGGYENSLTIGIDTRLSFCNGYNHFAAIPGYSPAFDRYWEYNRTSLAGFIANEFFLTDEISLLAGLRGEIFRNKIQGSTGTTTETSDQYAYETALLYRPVEQAKIFARATRYYHVPFVDEVVDTYTGVPNTDLEPETGYTFETGASAEILEHVTAGLTFYHMETEDEIYLDAVTYRNVNAPDDTSRDGVEASLTLADDDIGSIGVIYNYVKARFSEGVYEDNRIPMVPKQTVQLNGELNLTDEITLLATVNHVSSQRMEGDFANTAPKTLKPVTTLDLGVSYEPGFTEGLRLFAGVDNVTDKEYANYGGYYYNTWAGSHNYYYYPADARTWKLTASYTF